MSLSKSEFYDFLEARKAPLKCPICGQDRWAVLGRQDQDDRLPVVSVRTGAEWVPTKDDPELRKLIEYEEPVLWMVCRNCAFVRVHSATWIKGQEGVDYGTR